MYAPLVSALMARVAHTWEPCGRCYVQAPPFACSRAASSRKPGKFRLDWKEHQAFVARVNEFETGLRTGEANPDAVLSFMQEWLVKHIRYSDRLYTAHLNAHGIR